MIPLRDDNPSETIPVVTYLLVMANVAVFAYQAFIRISLGPHAAALFVFRAGLTPAELTHFSDIGPPDLVPVPLTILTSMFVHGGLLHLLGNMLFLWIFGDNIEDYMGHLRYLVFYIGTGVIATICHILGNPGSRIPVVGASGAISGVLGAYLLLYPKARVVTLIPIFFFFQIVRLPAFLFLGVWFVMQILSTGSGVGVAFLAHIGGFLAGLIAVPIFKRNRRRRRLDTHWE